MSTYSDVPFTEYEQVRDIGRDFDRLFRAEGGDGEVVLEGETDENSVDVEHLRYKVDFLMGLNERVAECWRSAKNLHSFVSRTAYRVGHFKAPRLDPEDKKTTGYQLLLEHILLRLVADGFKRYESEVYAPIFKDGVFTFSWRQECTTEEYVHRNIRRDRDFTQWVNATSNFQNIGCAANYLKTCVDDNFMDIEKRNGMYSFKNGVLFVCAPADGGAVGVERNVQFIEYRDSARLRQINRNWVSVKYFDEELDPAWVAGGRFDAIATPVFDKILQDQEVPASAMLWVYALFGRLLFPGGYDNWQVCPFLRGKPGTGKSSILANVVSRFYEHTDVGVLSDNMEEKFGLSAFHDKKLAIAMEITRGCALKAAEFQSMVSNEAMVVNTKFKTAQSVEAWTTPIVLAGNTTPDWATSSEAAARRIVYVAFNKVVRNPDPSMKDKLIAEVGRLILKCAMAYHLVREEVDRRGVWRCIDPWFLEQRERVMASINPMMSFVRSGKVLVAQGEACDFDEFKGLFKMHCSTNNFKLDKDVLSEEYFESAFERFGIVLGTVREFRQDANRTARWLDGIGIVQT